MFKDFDLLITRLCEPKAKANSDPIEQILVARRNKNMFWMFFALLICVPFFMILSGMPLKACLRVKLAHALNLTLFLSLCRSYLWIYHLFFLALNVVFPFVTLKVTSDLAYLQIGHCLLFPMIVLLLTNNQIYGLITVAVHFTLAVSKTKYILLENLETMDPSLFIDRMVHSGLTFSLAALIIFGVNLNRLNKRTREVTLANKINEDTIEKQKTFLFSFSHEMRNPLNSLLGNIELALMEALPSKAHEMIKTAQICAEVLLQNINNVLDTGKQDIGSLEINLAQVEVHSMFRRIWSLSGELIKRKRLRGTFKIDRKMPKVLLLDAHRINQVMINLIGNAIKFTEAGALNINVNWFEDSVINDEKFEPTPYDQENEGLFEKDQCMHLLTTPLKHFNEDSLSYEVKDYYILGSAKKVYEPQSSLLPQREIKGVLKIVISDTGCGMAEESLKKLFQKFSQVSNDPNKRKIGTGLGLFITKEICTKMEADIRVYSRLGTGTTFIICIPTMCISKRPQFQLQRSLASMFEMVSMKNLKCIVADDSPLNVAMICNFFEKISIKPVGTAGNGEEAFNLYKENRQAGEMVDIVTLDIDMPVMDGKAVCQKIREYEKMKGLTPVIVILISGNYDEEQIDVNEKKANWFLKKPIKFEEFSSTVLRLLYKVSEEACVLDSNNIK